MGVAVVPGGEVAGADTKTAADMACCSICPTTMIIARVLISAVGARTETAIAEGHDDMMTVIVTETESGAVHVVHEAVIMIETVMGEESVTEMVTRSVGEAEVGKDTGTGGVSCIHCASVNAIRLLSIAVGTKVHIFLQKY